jgi:hypothetical protein
MVKSRVRYLVLLSAFLAACAIQGRAGASSKEVLVAEPPMVHLGDMMYLSGNGFPPNTQLTITSRCSDWGSADPPIVQFTVSGAGPTTNARGQLVAAPFQPHLPPLADAPPWILECDYVPSFAGQGKGLVFPAYQAVNLQQGGILDPSWTTPTITYSIRRVRGAWTVQIYSWAGARIDGVIRYFPSGKSQHIARRLGWNATMTIKAPEGALSGTMHRPTVRLTATSALAEFVGKIDQCRYAESDTRTKRSRCS